MHHSNNSMRSAGKVGKKVSNNRRKKKSSMAFDALTVTESLGFQTHRKNSRNVWSQADDAKLTSLVDKAFKELGVPDGIQGVSNIRKSNELSRKVKWDQIIREFKDTSRKPKDLRKRWCGSLDPNLKKGKWTADEDARLLKAFEKHGAHWLSVSMDIEGRTEDQCAKRYMEVLGPDSKERLRQWTLEEDLQLINQVKLNGTKWRKISGQMNGRPSLTCRNRWRKIITLVVRGQASPEVALAVKENKEICATLTEKQNSLLKKADHRYHKVGNVSQKSNHTPISHLLSSDTTLDKKDKNNALEQDHVVTDLSLNKHETEKTVLGDSGNLHEPHDNLLASKSPESIFSNNNLDTTFNNFSNNSPGGNSISKSASPSYVDTLDKLHLISSSQSKDSNFVALSPADSSSLPVFTTLSKIDMKDKAYGNFNNYSESLATSNSNNFDDLSVTSDITNEMSKKIKLPNIPKNISEWNLTLSSPNTNVPVFDGTISTPDIVKEIIKQAKHNDLQITINQYVYQQNPSTGISSIGKSISANNNSYSKATSDQTHSYTAPSTSISDSSLKYHVPVHPTANTPPVINSADYTLNNGPVKADTPEFLERNWFAKSPLVFPDNGLGLSPAGQSDILGNFSGNHDPNFDVPMVNISTTEKSKSPQTNSRGSPLTLSPFGGSSSLSSNNSGNKFDLEPNRASHFNYLSPSLRPQLGSSKLNSARTSHLGRFLNPPPGTVKGNLLYIKKQKNTFHRSSSTPPSIIENTTKTKHFTLSMGHSKSQTSIKSPILTETEGLEFWESLRSLAEVATSKEGTTLTSNNTNNNETSNTLMSPNDEKADSPVTTV